MIKITYTNDQKPNEEPAIDKRDTENLRKESKIITIDHGSVSISITVEEQESTAIDDSEENEASEILKTYYLLVESKFGTKSVKGKQSITGDQEGELKVDVKNNSLSVTWSPEKNTIVPIVLIRTNILKKSCDTITDKKNNTVYRQSQWRSPSDIIPYDEPSIVPNHNSKEFSETKDNSLKNKVTVTKDSPLTGDDAIHENSTLGKFSCSVM